MRCAAGDLSSQIASLSLDPTGRVLTVTLSAALPDADRYTLTVTGALRSTAGASASGDAALTLAVLTGDVNASGEVTEADVVAAREQTGADLGKAARYDVDCSGDVTGADLVAIRQRVGSALP